MFITLFKNSRSLAINFIKKNCEFPYKISSNSINTLSNNTPRENSAEIDQNNNSTMFHDTDKIYVQCCPGKDLMRISFNLALEGGKSKHFNLSRRTTEPLSATIERLKLNVLKLMKPAKSKNKKEQESTTTTTDIGPIELLSKDGIVLNSADITNEDAWIEGATLNLIGKVYQVRTNDPQVEIKLPTCMMKSFIIMPTFSLNNCTIEHCKFQWFRQVSAEERDKLICDEPERFLHKSIQRDRGSIWYKLDDGLTYCPTDEDVAHFLMSVCQPSDGMKIGPEAYSISSNPVELGPLMCPFEKRHEYTKESLVESRKFRFVTYNILADLYADSDYSRTVLFGHCPSHALEIDYRRQLLLKELIGYNADIYCMQEVDKKEFTRTYQPFFENVGGYLGIYNTKGGQVAEGLATIYRSNKFSLIETHRTLLSDLIEPITNEQSVVVVEGKPVEDNENQEEEDRPPTQDSEHPILGDRKSGNAKKCLDQFNNIRSAILSKTELKKRFLERHTVLQTTLLKVLDEPNKYLLVANTHLYFAPDADHVRLLQGSVCMKYLEFIKDYYTKTLTNSEIDNQKVPKINLIFTGDMNSTPDCGLYRLTTEGSVDANLPDWSSNKEEAVEGLQISTNLRFLSAYENIEYTNYTPEFKGCLDYIYYERDNMICESVVPLPDHKEVTAIGGIPSDVFPSDHIALIANFELIN